MKIKKMKYKLIINLSDRLHMMGDKEQLIRNIK